MHKGNTMQKLGQSLDSLFSWNLRSLSSSMLPLENHGEVQTGDKVKAYSQQFFLQALPLTLLLSVSSPLALLSKAISCCTDTQDEESPLLAFENNPDWTHPIDDAIKIAVTSSEYQINGAANFPNSSWARWENSAHEDGTLCIEEGDRSGHALDFWRRPENLIEKLRLLNLKHYRFSVEWSAIEPSRGTINQEALQYYVGLCRSLKEAGIEPCVTLHHFSDPIWFLDAGGFENRENIAHFTDFAETVHRTLSPFVKEWVTFNEPAIYAFQGYVRGDYPPGVKDPKRAGLVLKHLMMAHCQTYDRLKPLDEEGKIGIAHNILRFRPYSRYNPMERLACHFVTMMTHQAVMDFFKTGFFNYQIPLTANVTFHEPAIRNKFDFFGVQYYTDPLLGMECSRKIMDSTCYPHEKMTDMPFRFFPQGLATALEECKDLGKPIWITETGAAASEEDQKEFIEKAFKVASFAKRQGVDLERVHIWTLQDNFEWNMGWKKKFGLISFDPLTESSHLRPSGAFIRERALIHAH